MYEDRMKRGVSFRWALFARILLLVIPILLIGEAVMYSEIKDRMFDTAKRDLTDNAEVQALAVQEWLGEMQTHLITASTATPVVGNDIESTSRYLKKLIKRVPPEIQCIHYTNVETGIIDASSCDKRVGKNVIKEGLEWFEPGIRGEYYISNPFPGRLDGKPIFVLTAPVYKDGKQTHILSFHPNLWRKTANMYKPTESGYTMLVDQEGTILTHPNLELVFKGNIFEDSKLSSIAQRALQGNKGFDKYTDQEGEEILVGYDSITISPQKRWGIFVIAPLREELEGLAVIKNVMVALIVVLISADLLVTLYITRNLARPLEALTSVVAKIRGGDLSLRAEEDSGVKEIDRLAVTFNDMVEQLDTHSRELEDRVQKRTLELEHSNKLKDLFTDIMRHDLLNHVSVIKGLSQLISTDVAEENRRSIEIMGKSAGKLEKMIQNAAKLAKIESLEKLEFEERDLCEILEDVISDFKPLLKERGMRVRFEGKSRCPARVNSSIEDVFSNLLSNAIKYSPKKTSITLGIREEDESWRIYVKDQGEGIPDEYKKAVFNRFRREDKKGVKGTGLGLTIVKRIVELHKGRVWVEDNPKGGSIFHVVIPKKSERG
jgi:signal transduction histidine kinase